jgi:hypothetical protein
MSRSYDSKSPAPLQWRSCGICDDGGQNGLGLLEDFIKFRPFTRVRELTRSAEKRDSLPNTEY